MKLPAFLSRLMPPRTKAAVSPLSWSDVGGALGWFGLVREGFAGAWQSVIQVDQPKDLMAFSPAFASVTLIASDIAKLGLGLVEEDDSGICTPVASNSPYWQPLRRPNHYQNRIRFIEHWMLSKLLAGNTYVFKERDERRVVRALYILDPNRVKPIVTPMGDVYYELAADDLAGVNKKIAVPASEIIHDRMNCLWHPLVGVSPLYAAGWSATMGSRIQRNSANFFANMSRPGGMLSAPGTIEEETAARLKRTFEDEFSGDKIGRLFVAGDGLEFKPMSIAAEAAQLVDQLNWTAVDVARAFHMPLFKIGAETGRNIGNLSIEAQQQLYLNDCLHIHIEDIELCLTEGLELKSGYLVDIDEDGMLRMDKGAQADALTKLIGGGVMTPNEGRLKIGYKPLTGGDTVYLQQQQFGIQALFERDQNKPFAKPDKPAPPPASDPATPVQGEGKTSEEVIDSATIDVIQKIAYADARGLLFPEENVHAV